MVGDILRNGYSKLMSNCGHVL